MSLVVFDFVALEHLGAEHEHEEVVESIRDGLTAKVTGFRDGRVDRTVVNENGGDFGGSWAGVEKDEGFVETASVVGGFDGRRWCFLMAQGATDTVGSWLIDFCPEKWRCGVAQGQHTTVRHGNLCNNGNTNAV